MGLEFSEGTSTLVHLLLCLSKPLVILIMVSQSKKNNKWLKVKERDRYVTIVEDLITYYNSIIVYMVFHRMKNLLASIVLGNFSKLNGDLNEEMILIGVLLPLPRFIPQELQTGISTVDVLDTWLVMLPSSQISRNAVQDTLCSKMELEERFLANDLLTNMVFHVFKMWD